jgi:predicted Rossmann fold flavoprotein
MGVATLTSSGLVIVVGGGPAGLMAAGQAAAAGAPVLLLERMGRLGTKLRLTGNGRCNLTNLADLDDFLAHFGKSGPFLRNAFARFFAPDLLAFFEGLGVPTVVEEGGRVFPASNEARDVAEALDRFTQGQGVEVRLHSRAARLLLDGDLVWGVALEDGQQIAAGAVIVATGGASYPQTGSSGDGYRLAEQAGHTLAPIRPALVPLAIAGPEPRAMMGLALRGVEARLLIDGQELARGSGEMLFTHFGVSGPLILTLSGPAVEWIGRGRLELSIDLRPDLTAEQLDAELRAELERHGRRTFRNLLKGLLPAKMADVVAARSGILPGKPAHQVTAAERARLGALLQDFRLAVAGHRPLAEAMVTAGGIDTREVDPTTMASRLVKGLYFAGELLDAQADTGGFNLQAAFSTGYVAGRAAAGYVTRG